MRFNFKDLLKLGTGIFLLYLCINYWKDVAEIISMVISAASPLIIGGTVAYFINIIMSFYERHYFPKSKKQFVIKSRRPVCMMIAFLSVIAVISLVIRLVVPQFVSCIQLLLKELPGSLSYLVSKGYELHIIPENLAEILMDIDWQSRIGGIVEMLTAGVGNIMNVAVKTLTTVFSGVVTTLLSIIFAFYILGSKDRIKAQFIRVCGHYLKPLWFKKVFYVFDVLNDCFHRYFVGQCTEAVVLGVLCTFGMWIFRFPYAPMIGALVAFTALIPVAGSYIGAIVGAIMLLTISPLKSLMFLIFIVILQQIEGNLIYPKVVGNSIGLPGIWVLAAVTIGGGIMGVAGMLIGVPVAAAVYRIVRDDINGNSVLTEK